MRYERLYARMDDRTREFLHGTEPTMHPYAVIDSQDIQISYKAKAIAAFGKSTGCSMASAHSATDVFDPNAILVGYFPQTDENKTSLFTRRMLDLFQNAVVMGTQVPQIKSAREYSFHTAADKVKFDLIRKAAACNDRNIYIEGLEDICNNNFLPELKKLAADRRVVALLPFDVYIMATCKVDTGHPKIIKEVCSNGISYVGFLAGLKEMQKRNCKTLPDILQQA